MTAKHSLWFVTWLLVAALAAWHVYLLAVGLPQTQVAEAPLGAASAPAMLVYRPYLPALCSLAALGVLALGLARAAWRPLAWLGVGFNVAVGALLIFSLGVVYLAAAGALVVALSLLEWATQRRIQWLLAALAGDVVIGLTGRLFGWTTYGSPFIALSVALLAVIVSLGLTQRRSLPA